MEKIVWTEQSKDDLKEIYDFISKDSLYYASETVDKIINLAEKLEDFPLSGRMVPEVQNELIREIILGNYRIIYLYAKSIKILTIYHTSRLLSFDEIDQFLTD
jgi:addiction module RelE/StbE family toxin